MIWLIDLTTYSKPAADEAQKIKADYFKIKKYVRHKVLGEHLEPKTRTYSYGVLRLATILNANSVECEYIHHQDIEKKLNEYTSAPSVVAFSAVCPTIGTADMLKQKIQKKYNDAVFAIGGPHINVARKLTEARYPGFDIYCDKNDIAAAEALAGKKLNIIPPDFVDFNLLPFTINEYQINTASTLGCPYSCKYCQDNCVDYKELSGDGDISYFKKHLKPKTCIHFFDSTFGGNKIRLKHICDNLQKIGHDFILSCDIRAEMIDASTVEYLKRAGIREVRMGIETVDDAVLKINNRTLKPESFFNAAKILRDKSDIYVTAYSVLGLPGSTKKSFEKTAKTFSEMLENRVVDEIKNCIYVPYPMDEVNNKHLNIINQNWDDYDRQSFPVYNLKHATAFEIWSAYLELSRQINASWQKGFKIKDLSEIPGSYSEYVAEFYGYKSNKGGKI